MMTRIQSFAITPLPKQIALTSDLNRLMENFNINNYPLRLYEKFVNDSKNNIVYRVPKCFQFNDFNIIELLFLQGLPHGHLSDDQFISQDGSNKNGYWQVSFPEDSYTALSSLLIEFHRRPNYFMKRICHFVKKRGSSYR
ncbi:hypothetical protein [Coxiella-like endosymbiont]|uniref:hypothetical protein n=1 Tax=Coxiella-like endosymbiont TaxID=1592897 RepID=UPI00272D8D80|nr:hypothetical protein [Coxiella-like endosymbiont]